MQSARTTSTSSVFSLGKTDQKNSAENPADGISRIPATEFPNRYLIRDIDGEKALSCIEAPNIIVQIKFGLSVSAAAMNKSAPGTIYLDGVAQHGPLLDNARQIYNFDHHEGCVRAFTLSTCEQVLIMLKKGFDLRTREWRVIANDPDLDTVLAIWLLLNHIRISEQESIRQHILLPLIRLEGAIDALGLELKELTGLSPAQINQSQRIIDHLRRQELRIKKDALWGEETDFFEYTADMLHNIDQIMYKPEKLGELLGIEELARVNLPDNRVAVVVQSDMGIYEIEPLLKKIYGTSIGLAILRRTETAYTVRQIDPFLDGSLENVYEKLNFMDPAVKCRTQDKWGGSSDIGGSPRDRGTQLTPEEIAEGCQEAFQKYSFAQRGLQFMVVAVLAAGVLAVSAFVTTHLHPGKWIASPLVGSFLVDPYLRFSLALILLTTIILAVISRGRLWQFGIISAVGKNWWLALPVGILGAFAGGAWMPVEHPSYQVADISRLLLGSMLLAFASEYLFRGVLHGIMTRKSRIQSSDSKFFISWPNIGTAFLYALFLTLLPFFHNETFNPYSITLQQGSIYFSGFFFSLVLGSVRERSHSVLSSFIIHFIAVLFILFLPDLLIYIHVL
jgi:membrane protease YdiL (CAAX protease family)